MEVMSYLQEYFNNENTIVTVFFINYYYYSDSTFSYLIYFSYMSHSIPNHSPPSSSHTTVLSHHIHTCRAPFGIASWHTKACSSCISSSHTRSRTRTLLFWVKVMCVPPLNPDLYVSRHLFIFLMQHHLMLFSQSCLCLKIHEKGLRH